MENTKTKIKHFAFALVFSIAAANAAFSQNASVAKTVPPLPPKKVDSEKSLAVDAKVNISLCVLQGNVKINGWEREEVRLFVRRGNAVEFKVRDTHKQSGKAVWITVLSSDAGKVSECFSGEEIEIDVPRGASVRMKSEESKTVVDSIRRASVVNIGGDISLRNISEGGNASTYEGDVSVENSSGSFTLESLNGNILAFELAPGEIGDVFKAKTSNGAIVLQDLEHRQVEINSISGAISFVGAIAGGGSYHFTTSNGAIALTIPKETSCKMSATYGFGGFNSELAITRLTENKTPRSQSIVGIMGDGDATLNLTTASGSIKIKSKK